MRSPTFAAPAVPSAVRAVSPAAVAGPGAFAEQAARAPASTSVVAMLLLVIRLFVIVTMIVPEALSRQITIARPLLALPSAKRAGIQVHEIRCAVVADPTAFQILSMSGEIRAIDPG